jgi:hypothetical protein
MNMAAKHPLSDETVLLTIEALEQRLKRHTTGDFEIPLETTRLVMDRYNLNNRPISDLQVKRYAQFMSQGWTDTGESIVFSSQPALLSGQHRFLAALATGTSFTSVVVFGRPPEAAKVMDSGRTRSPADMLATMRAEYPKIAATAVKWVEWIEIGKVKWRPGFSTLQVMALYAKHGDVEDWVPEARKIASRNKQSVPTVAALLHQFNKVDRDLAAEFSLRWQEGTVPPRFRGITQMQQELDRMIKAGVPKGSHEFEIRRAAMAVNAWNFARADTQRIGIPIKWDMSKPFPEIK